MHITQQDMDILASLTHKGGDSLTALDGAHMQALRDMGLVERNALSKKGASVLAQHKVDNAVILAAGLSSRFAPLSYEGPKGLLTVKGEVLIERQIRQLQEAGIDEIYVVVGYKKEHFFYLAEKFNVTIVVNREYATRNNNSSMWVVRNKLANTYICSADNYFDVNPFRAYVANPYYAAQYSAGPTKEWILTADDEGRIERVSIGGDMGWYMIGEAYLDAQFSKRFVEILEEEYSSPKTAPKLWEDIYVEHIDELVLYIKPNESDTAHEFDSIDELRSFDDSFLRNVKSKVFDNIVQVTGCDQTEIHDVYPLTESLTNLSCHFATNTQEYVYRHPGVGTSNIINRKNEKAALIAARDAGFDYTFIYANAEQGWKISRFVPGATTLDIHSDEGLQQAMKVCRDLHKSGIELESTFDFYKSAQHYEDVLCSKGVLDVPEYEALKASAQKLHDFLEADHVPQTINHNDFFYLNFLIEQDGTFNLIDWEYAGMGDFCNDIATFSVCCQLDDREIDAAIHYFFEGSEDDFDKCHVYGLIGMCGWCWYVWGLLKESDGDNIGEWLYIYYSYAKRFIKRALVLYEQAQGDDSSCNWAF